MGFALGIIEVLKHEMNYHDFISYLISVHIECHICFYAIIYKRKCILSINMFVNIPIFESFYDVKLKS